MAAEGKEGTEERAVCLRCSLSSTGAAPTARGTHARGVSSSLLVVLISLLAATGARAHNISKVRTAPQQTLKLCVVDAAPALSLRPGVNITDGTLLSSTDANNMLQGQSMDMINAIFGQILQWPYTVTYFDAVKTGFSQTVYLARLGEACDVGVQSFFISSGRDLCVTGCQMPATNTVFTSDSDYERYCCCVDFSYPYFIGGWSFMSQISTGDVDYIGVFFQRDIVQAMCVCVICLFFTAHLIWLIERTQFGRSVLLTNPKEGFSKFYLDGLKDGVWFSTMTLMNGVVSSEKTVITPLGRLVATAWVLFGILMSAFVTAVIAASLTTAMLTTTAILTANDVAGKVVCTSEGFFDSFFDTSFPAIGVQKVLVPNIQDCFPMVSAGTVDAAFTIREEALGYFAAGLGSGLVITPTVKAQNYGMVWTQSWAYEDWVNEALLMWQQNAVATQPPYADSIQRWYYGDPHQITYGGSVEPANQTWNWALIGTAVALIGSYMLLQIFVIIAHWRMKKQSYDERSMTAAGRQSFMIRAASAIAAPPDALTHQPSDVGENLATSFRKVSFNHNPSVRCSISRGAYLTPPPPVQDPGVLSSQGSADSAILSLLSDMKRQLDVLTAAHEAALGLNPVFVDKSKRRKSQQAMPEPPADATTGDVSMTILKVESDQSQIALLQEQPKPPTGSGGMVEVNLGNKHAGKTWSC